MNFEWRLKKKVQNWYLLMEKPHGDDGTSTLVLLKGAHFPGNIVDWGKLKLDPK